MAYNHGREERKWRIWKEAEEKILRDCGVPESTIEEIRIYDRADFNSNRRFYRWTNDVAEYLEDMQDKQKPKEIATITDLLDEIENEKLYRALRLPKDVDELIIGEEQAELLRKVIAALPEIQRRRFLLYHEYDLNYYQLGAMEHCTPQAVRRSVIIAREKIKAQMKEYLCA